MQYNNTQYENETLITKKAMINMQLVTSKRYLQYKKITENKLVKVTILFPDLPSVEAIKAFFILLSIATTFYSTFFYFILENPECLFMLLKCLLKKQTPTPLKLVFHVRQNFTGHQHFKCEQPLSYWTD